jgi:hypothetical protein
LALTKPMNDWGGIAELDMSVNWIEDSPLKTIVKKLPLTVVTGYSEIIHYNNGP